MSRISNWHISFITKGTGKTLALLVASLGWQTAEYDRLLATQKENEAATKTNPESIKNSGMDTPGYMQVLPGSDDLVIHKMKRELPFDSPAQSPKLSVPKIYYTSRTQKQVRV